LKEGIVTIEAHETDAAEQRRLVRYVHLVREVRSLLGRSEGTAWLREHHDLADRSIAGLEMEWAREKNRRGLD
jgi:hypothetical protein